MPTPPRLQFRSTEAKTVSVAGDFNDWCGSIKGSFDATIGKMARHADGLWEFLLSGITTGNHQFKFIINGEWEPGANRFFFIDERGRLNDPTGGISQVMLENVKTLRVSFTIQAGLPKDLNDLTFVLHPKGKVISAFRVTGKGSEGDSVLLDIRGIDVTEGIKLEVRGLGNRPVTRPVCLDTFFQRHFISNKPLGVSIEGDPTTTVFRVFAPRARKVAVKVYEDADKIRILKDINGLQDPDGVWEMHLPGTHWGSFYGFMIDGPHGEGEGFDAKKLWPDPYARASVFHNGPSILIDPASRGSFKGWEDTTFRTPAREELIVWECSVRDLTTHPSSGVPKALRGKYAGLPATVGTGAGLDHAKALGINALEFLPIYEFDDNPPGSYHWGYMPSLFFAPEASFASNPYGGQIHEFKSLVNACHKEGMAVILDVVYNHTGAPQILMGMDKKYFYRHDGKLVLQNFSGCGNDFKTELPMARRLIIDSLEHWITEYHVDGFRFDLAELIDLGTLTIIEDRLKKIKPDIILISEPWSFRGTNKGQLKRTSWANWNDDFRNRIKDVVQGKANASTLLPVLKGSVDLWTSSPWESVNYVESHDNFTLVDHLSDRSDHDGSNPGDFEIRRNLFCAAAVLLSPGIPMLAQGQEMLRSKRGNGNSYNAGDGVNTVDYGLKNLFPAVYAFYRDLIALRQSEDGAIIRTLDGEACKAAEIVPTQNTNAIGIHWKPSRHAPLRTKQMIVLFNADPTGPAIFTPRLSTGIWERRVGDGKVFKAHAHFLRELIIAKTEAGGTPIEVPPLSVAVWLPR
ncbi:MAG: alpha-amylase family glycosyl hydrolase [Candidatus Ozemobacteraceae bacterium]